MEVARADLAYRTFWSLCEHQQEGKHGNPSLGRFPFRAGFTWASSLHLFDVLDYSDGASSPYKQVKRCLEVKS